MQHALGRGLLGDVARPLEAGWRAGGLHVDARRQAVIDGAQRLLVGADGEGAGHVEVRQDVVAPLLEAGAADAIDVVALPHDVAGHALDPGAGPVGVDPGYLLPLAHDLGDLLGFLRAAEPRLAIERSEEHTSELQSLMRISYAAFC